jgi:hypothetical protein
MKRGRQWLNQVSTDLGEGQFAKLIVDIGAELHVVIPCEGYEATFKNKQALIQYRDLLQQANSVEVLGHQSPSEPAFLNAGHRVVDLSDIVIAVWDGREARGTGGTADIVRYAKERGKEVLLVWPSGVSRSNHE